MAHVEARATRRLHAAASEHMRHIAASDVMIGILRDALHTQRTLFKQYLHTTANSPTSPTASPPPRDHGETGVHPSSTVNLECALGDISLYDTAPSISSRASSLSSSSSSTSTSFNDTSAPPPPPPPRDIPSLLTLLALRDSEIRALRDRIHSLSISLDFAGQGSRKAADAVSTVREIIHGSGDGDGNGDGGGTTASGQGHRTKASGHDNEKSVSYTLCPGCAKDPSKSRPTPMHLRHLGCITAGDDEHGPPPTLLTSTLSRRLRKLKRPSPQERRSRSLSGVVEARRRTPRGKGIGKRRRERGGSGLAGRLGADPRGGSPLRGRKANGLRSDGEGGEVSEPDNSDDEDEEEEGEEEGLLSTKIARLELEKDALKVKATLACDLEAKARQALSQAESRLTVLEDEVVVLRGKEKELKMTVRDLRRLAMRLNPDGLNRWSQTHEANAGATSNGSVCCGGGHHGDVSGVEKDSAEDFKTSRSTRDGHCTCVCGKDLSSSSSGSSSLTSTFSPSSVEDIIPRCCCEWKAEVEALRNALSEKLAKVKQLEVEAKKTNAHAHKVIQVG